MSDFVNWDSRPLREWQARYAPGRVISLAGRTTHYVEKGQGEPVILIHGFNMDLNTWCRNIDAMAGSFRVFALDLWGFGYSTREMLPFGYELFAQQLHLFMESLGIRQASLIGHSMGGGVAIKYACLHRDRVEKLILVDAAGISNPLPFRARFYNLPGVGEFLMSLRTDAIRRKNLEDIWIYDRASLTDQYYEEATRFQKIEGTSRVLLHILRDRFLHSLDEDVHRLGTLNVPALIIWGRHDPSIKTAIGEEMHRRLPGSCFEIIENASHMPNFDCPDTFNRLAIDFLRHGQGC